MSIPAEGYPRTAAVSPRVHVIETVDSTNAHLLADVARDPQSHPHLSVIITRDQRAGRGRLDRRWTTPPNTALAVSVLLRVGALPFAARGWIPLIAGIAMTRAVAAQLPRRSVEFKWPNDVLVDGRKIAGILAEVAPADAATVVVGVGVNTSMADVDLPVPTATSFAVLGEVADEDELVADFVAGLRDRIAALTVAGGPDDALRAEVEELCATLGAEVSVSLPDGTVLQGVGVRLDVDGRLVIESAGVESVVAAADIVHVRPRR